ncbi:Hypothetical predicted protein [Xyrichtys novacula]|uniref:Uncharacterized protein n=1 Tax=Xyrichtys novacula TaxID=13765 RepID=A0AAV1ELF3_XYRNO|nr:Hypothetical predicted protein [Xyrichtys novacula]
MTADGKNKSRDRERGNEAGNKLPSEEVNMASMNDKSSLNPPEAESSKRIYPIYGKIWKTSIFTREKKVSDCVCEPCDAAATALTFRTPPGGRTRVERGQSSPELCHSFLPERSFA